MIPVNFSKEAPSIGHPVYNTYGKRDEGIVYGIELTSTDIITIASLFWDEDDNRGSLEEFLSYDDNDYNSINNGLSQDLTEYMHDIVSWTKKAGIGLHVKPESEDDDSIPPRPFVLGIKYPIDLKKNYIIRDSYAQLMHLKKNVTPMAVWEHSFLGDVRRFDFEYYESEPSSFITPSALWSETFHDLHIHDFERLQDLGDVVDIMYDRAGIKKNISPIISILV